MKQYLIHTGGEVVEKQDKVYIVEANSKEKAQEIAKMNFMEEFCVVNEHIYTKSYKRDWKVWLAIICMIIPIMLSFIGWRRGHDVVYIGPNYLSCLCSALVYLAFLVRFKGIHRIFETKIDIVLYIMIVLLLSSFIQTLFVKESIDILGITEISVDTKIIILFAIILSWCGVKIVSVICMMSVWILTISNIITLNEAMGNLWGFIYIITASIGVVLYLSVEPAIIEAMPYMKKSLYHGINYLKKDFIEVGNSVNNMKDLLKNNRR